MSNTQESNSFKPTLWLSFIAAVQFLTRLHLTGNTKYPAEVYNAALRRGVVFFPLIGGLIGCYTALILIAASLAGLSPWVATLLAIGFEALLTGAFHEDALADSLDALGGGWSRVQVLEIMKDSRLGTYGTVGLIIGIGLRVSASAALLSMDYQWTVASIIAASALARLAIVGMMVTTVPITDRNSQAKDISGTQTWRTFFIALVLSIPLISFWVWFNPWCCITATAISIILLWWFRRTILYRVSGTTGDLLGCSAYLIQLVILITSSGTLFIYD